VRKRSVDVSARVYATPNNSLYSKTGKPFSIIVENRLLSENENRGKCFPGTKSAEPKTQATKRGIRGRKEAPRGGERKQRGRRASKESS
jgi:hypothetical protein